MVTFAAPSPNFIWGGYRQRRVLSGSRSRLGKVFGIGARDLVASAGRAALDRVKGKAPQRRRTESTVFCGFQPLDASAVTICSVTIGQKWRFSVGRRLIADYASAPIGGIELGAAGAARGRARARGGAPFRCEFCPTPVARIAAGLREKFLAPMPVSAGRANSAIGHGVGGRGAPALPRTGRSEAEKTGPGAGKPRERTLAARSDAAANLDAVVAMVQGGGRPFGVKGTATLCAPGLDVN